VSLFSNNKYQYRETYFVLFNSENCPTADEVQMVLGSLGPRYETVNLKETEDGFESMTVKSPRDFSAMDIVFTRGEEVTSQIEEIQEAMRTMTLSGDDMKKLSSLKNCDARFDIFHFEEIATATEDDQFLDPGGLLLVLEALAELCNGVALDPQSNSLM
jgi:hypothetical protein